jgi:hypothetical protein
MCWLGNVCSYDLCAWAPSDSMQNWWDNMDRTPSVARCGLHSIVFWCVRGMERKKCKDLQVAQRDPKPPNPTKDQRWGQSLGNGKRKTLSYSVASLLTSSDWVFFPSPMGSFLSHSCWSCTDLSFKFVQCLFRLPSFNITSSSPGNSIKKNKAWERTAFCTSNLGRNLRVEINCNALNFSNTNFTFTCSCAGAFWLQQLFLRTTFGFGFWDSGLYLRVFGVRLNIGFKSFGDFDWDLHNSPPSCWSEP